MMSAVIIGTSGSYSGVATTFDSKELRISTSPEHGDTIARIESIMLENCKDLIARRLSEIQEGGAHDRRTKVFSNDFWASQGDILFPKIIQSVIAEILKFEAKKEFEDFGISDLMTRSSPSAIRLLSGVLSTRLRGRDCVPRSP
jgi:hypothetical protein